MHLLSVTVRNYRVHRELTVTFDRARTLIGGPNEAGKSTLIEALHRGLFFPAKSGAEPQQRMRSILHTGHPEIEIGFEAGRATYRLQKRFSGQTGTTTLTELGGITLQGSQAEERLAQVLGVAGDVGANAATKQWAHLWVWQGISGESPETDVTTQRDSLLARLQFMGGAAVMQSDLDGRVAALVAERLERSVNLNGKPKTGSDLEKAQTELQAAELALTAARENLSRLQGAMNDVQVASDTIKAAEENLALITADHVAAVARHERAVALQQQLTNEERLAREAAARADELAKTNVRIVRLENDLKALRKATEPLQNELGLRTAARLEAARICGEAHKLAKQSADKLRDWNLRRELAGACLQLSEKRIEHQAVSDRLQQGRVVEATVNAQRGKLAELPEITAAGVRKLQAMDRELATARAALDAMAAGVEVIATQVAVVAGDHPLGEGEIHIVTEDTEVTVGAATRLRIRPGGGQSLSEAREAVASAGKKLRAALDSHALNSVAAAVEAGARRETLMAEIKAGQLRLDDFNIPALGDQVAEVAKAIAAAEGQIGRLTSELPGTTAPSDVASARQVVAELETSSRPVTTADRRARAEADTAREKLAEAEKALEQQREKCAQESRRITEAEAELKVLTEVNGDGPSRAHACSIAQTAAEAAAKTSATTKQALEALQPELVAAAVTRLGRALEEKRRVINEAELKRAGAQALLRSDGSNDPTAEVAQWEARRQLAKVRFDSATRQVAAIRLLDQLFREEQRQLAERFTRPLAEKISGYLECVLGAGARAVLSLRENAFEGLQLVRPSGSLGAVSFDGLSGGTREQFAAAVRLAAAEVLAADHGNCLPVVFDDAFAFSDGERVKGVQAMLDLAARRGLQLIVLSCNPSDYSTLGARECYITRQLGSSLSGASRALAEPSPSPGGSPAESTSGVGSPTSERPNPQHEMLLTVLRRLGGSKGNQSLREALGWDEPLYESVKQSLVEQGALVPGRGRGGSVALVDVRKE